ncbi:MAG: hypothetical protein ACJAVR_002266 [Paracoccaceae bacterium]|jgi:hypothetical protein
MTRAKHHKARRGAVTLAAMSAIVAAAAATAVLAQTADAPAPLDGAIPSASNVLPADALPEPTPEAEPTPQPEPEPAPVEEAAEDAQPGYRGVRLAGNLPTAVSPNPERRITLSLSETISGDTDIGLDGGGAAFGSNTRAGVQYISIGPISSFRVGANIGLNYFTGSGASSADLNVPTPDLSVGWQRSLSRTTQVSLGFNGSLKPETLTGDPTFALAQNDDGSLFIETTDGQDKDALRLSLAASGSLNHTVNALNSLSMSFNASKVDYINGSDSLTPYIRFGLNGGWDAQLSPTVSGGLSAGASAYFSDGADERTTYTFNVSGNSGWTVNRRMSVNASLGPSLSFTSRTDTNTGLGDEYSSVSARAQIGISYALRDTSWSAGLSQGVQPTTQGSIANLTSLTLQMNHSVNEASSVSLASSLSYQLPLSQQDEADVGNDMNLTLRAAYNYALTRDVNASLGYALRWKDQEVNSFVSHKVFLTLTKSFTFLP